MATRRVVRGAASVIRQRGQAALLTVVILALGLGTLFYNFFGTNWQSTYTAKITHDALAQAKAGLIAYAAADANRPGSLPCPDTNNDGSAEPYSGSDCPSYIGRLPWRTLGLPDLRDGSGERLWYAVTGVFARNPSCGSACPLNTDTKGTLTVTGISPAANVIAIAFAAGPTIGAQNRSTANQNNVAHYLEGGNETGIGTSTFVSGTTTTTFNDRLLLLSGADVMTPVEMRAAREILTLLWAYRSASNDGAGPLCDCYPWADVWDGASNDDNYAGRVPLLSALPHDWSTLNINTTTYPALTWLRNNRWWWVFFYTIASQESESKGGGYLTINGVGGTSVVLITTGPAGAGRPITTWDSDADWAAYVDDPDNRDMSTQFYTPWATTYARDRLYTLF
jgi:hypothetical protein